MKRLTLILIMLMASSVRAATIYVDNSVADCIGTYSVANRNATGSETSYDTPQEAQDIANPDDFIYFRAGRYTNPSENDDADVLKILRSGTEGHPITYTNYNNEVVILDASRDGDNGHNYTVTMGTKPSTVDNSGSGVTDITIDGLIIEGAWAVGMRICGEADFSGTAVVPSRRISIKNCIARYQIGINGWGQGIATVGTVFNVVIEDCEFYENTGTGVEFGRLSKDLHWAEPDDDRSTANDSIIRNCLSYNNDDPCRPGNTDGIGSSHSYNCTIEDCISFGNSDDGMDVYGALQNTIQNNLVFYNLAYPDAGSGTGIKISAGGGGRHTVRSNISYGNKGMGIEGSDSSYQEYPSLIYNNITCDVNNTGIALCYEISYDANSPGYEKSFLRNNIFVDSNNNDVYHIFAAISDCDYNFIGMEANYNEQQGYGMDANSLTGTTGLHEQDVVIDVNFVGMTFAEKLAHIRSQFATAFALNEGSLLIDAGEIVEGYHNATAGPGELEVWYGLAPDIGVYESNYDVTDTYLMAKEE